ncbi:hypothetical protein A2415_04230 [candidate division WWE3 bacterium RIFOXYC1_FULL_39_7]|uniref:Phosphoglycerate kinase n=2 Tax=Katanobacteria TaxID=422282 RepID=A0A1F4X7K0_UNCKA|nr:MAG: hypothetical protein A2415_04230 [candidate division WWE3 bacterium RIFOXYC1_FULL_39_7]OGC77657.1 MAG: hypothetical protein A2619_05485 [candidate division WWE3 bacterium RIFOXYD1_FULL_39_9]
MKSLREAPINIGTKVFIAADLDVPMENGTILETYRLDNLIPTIKYVLEKGGIPILGGHIGSPKGQIVDELSTKRLKLYFDEKLGVGNYMLLENLRFDKREEENSVDYAKELAGKADVYVNENFSTSHRNHASIVQLPRLLPSYAGFRLEDEVANLSKVIDSPRRPLVAIIGGAKLESKKPTVSRFIELADYVLIGGRIGLEWAEEIPGNLILPLDYQDDNKDIGSETIEKYCDIISSAKTVLWAGPLGMYEEDKYIIGTRKIAEAITKNTDCFSVIGGGDLVAATNKLGLLTNFGFVSTGGGAMLEFLVKSTLPGIEALN